MKSTLLILFTASFIAAEPDAQQDTKPYRKWNARSEADPTPISDQKWVRLCFSNTNAIAAQSVVIATIRFDESGRPPNVVCV